MDVTIWTLVYIDVSEPDICVLEVSAQKEVNVTVLDIIVWKLVYIDLSPQKKANVTVQHIKTI